MDADNNKDMEHIEVLQTPDTKAMAAFVAAAGIRQDAAGDIIAKLWEQDLTPNTMREVTTPDLENIGITKMAHRKKLRRHSMSLPTLLESRPEFQWSNSDRVFQEATNQNESSAVAGEASALTEEVIAVDETNAKPPAVTTEIIQMMHGLQEEIQALRNPNLSDATANLDPDMQNGWDEGIGDFTLCKKEGSRLNIHIQ